MLKKLTKVLVINCFIITTLMMILSTQVFAALGDTIFSLLSKGTVETASIPSVGTIKNLPPYFPEGYYCMNHGYHYDGGEFRVYETGNANSLDGGTGRLSFAFGEHKRALEAGIPGATTDINRPNDPWVNYVWSLGLGHNSQQPDSSTFAGIEAKFAKYQEIYNDIVANGNNPLKIVPIDPTGTPVDVTAGGVLSADTSNRVKFEIEYPWDPVLNQYYGSFSNFTPTGLLDLVDISISMNGNELFNSKVTSTNKLQRADGTPFQMGDKEVYISVDDVNYGASNKISLVWNFKYYTEASYAKLEYVGDGENTPYQDVLYLENGMETIGKNVELDVIVGQPNFKISFEKLDKLTLARLAGIQFQISVDGGNVLVDPTNNTLANPHTITTIDGETVVEIKPDNRNGIVNQITVRFKEISVPNGMNYLIYRGELELVATWNPTTLEWEFSHINLPSYLGSQESATGMKIEKNSFKLTAENKPIPNMKIKLNKIDTLTGAKLAGVTFNVDVVNGTVVGNGSIITDATSDTEIEIQPNKDTGVGNVPDVIVKLSEVNVPNGYLKFVEDIEITFRWDPNDCEWKQVNLKIPQTNGVQEEVEIIKDNATNTYQLIAKNKPIKNIKILLDKIDSLTGSKLGGVTFEIQVDNGTVANGSSTITTNGSSNTEIEIQPNQPSSSGVVPDITVRLKEISLAIPNSYLIYQGDIELVFSWDPNTCDWENISIKFPEYQNGVKEKAEITKDGTELGLFTLTAENRPNIEELSGHVWIDIPQGNKQIDPPNGIYDTNEPLKEGIEVYLYNADDGTQVIMDGYGNPLPNNGVLITDANGAYKFENIPKTSGSGYYIVFKYDGITYIRTIDGESKAAEVDRQTFNSRFKTISAGKSNDGTALEYNYNAGTFKSTLITLDGNGRVLDKFAILADTKTAGNIYNQTANDIDLGLRQKEVDLALMTDLNKATASINGQAPASYDYNTIFNNANMNGILNLSQDKTSSDGVTYNLNLYKSDYNYRIGDYLNNATMRTGQPTLTPEESKAFQDNGKELEVLLDYGVVLNNQSGVEAQVNQFVYMYDSHLEYVSINGGKATDDGSKLIIVPDNPTLGYGGQTKIIITFKYKLDSESLDNQPTIINRAEILEYSTTEGGYVDCDSAPGNAFEASGFKYEDDSDEARGLIIKATKTERELSGYVFEDNKTNSNSDYNAGDGILDDTSETKVDDVIVQLVEIKDLTVGGQTLKLEYIWQETTSGSNTVRAVALDGKSVGSYNVTPETGKYTFKEFIPGDYVVRFIYGDGTYYDTAIDGKNILKYNGQDYKSTTDSNYTEKYLTISKYSPGASMARDLEARRLRVMAYALGLKDTELDNLVIDKKEKLVNTWMAADTSRLPVADVLVKPGESEFKAQVNFGLIARPVISLSLRKHITAVNLTGGDANMNVSATVGMDQYLDNNTEIKNFANSKISESHPLTAKATTRGNRGYWQVETTKIEGAKIELTYSYKIKNSGDKDYLSSKLMDEFNISGNDVETATKEYIQAIENRISAVEKGMKLVGSNNGNIPYQIKDSYLGVAYYTGVVATDDVEVGIFAELEDYLSNDLALDITSDFEVKGTASKDVLNVSGNVEKENVKVIKTKMPTKLSDTKIEDYKIKLVKTGLTASADNLEMRSYIAQIIAPTTNLAGTRITGTTPNNLRYVQSYADMATLENIGTEDDEYWAETFRIIPSTGGDKFTVPVIIISVVSGLTIIAIGIVLIKKLIIK